MWSLLLELNDASWSLNYRHNSLIQYILAWTKISIITWLVILVEEWDLKKKVFVFKCGHRVQLYLNVFWFKILQWLACIPAANSEHQSNIHSFIFLLNLSPEVIVVAACVFKPIIFCFLNLPSCLFRVSRFLKLLCVKLSWPRYT